MGRIFRFSALALGIVAAFLCLPFVSVVFAQGPLPAAVPAAGMGAAPFLPMIATVCGALGFWLRKKLPEQHWIDTLKGKAALLAGGALLGGIMTAIADYFAGGGGLSAMSIAVVAAGALANGIAALVGASSPKPSLAIWIPVCLLSGLSLAACSLAVRQAGGAAFARTMASCEKAELASLAKYEPDAKRVLMACVSMADCEQALLAIGATDGVTLLGHQLACLVASAGASLQAMVDASMATDGGGLPDGGMFAFGGASPAAAGRGAANAAELLKKLGR